MLGDLNRCRDPWDTISSLPSSPSLPQRPLLRATSLHRLMCICLCGYSTFIFIKMQSKYNSFNKYLSNTHYMPGTVLDAAVNKIVNETDSSEACFVHIKVCFYSWSSWTPIFLFLFSGFLLSHCMVLLTIPLLTGIRDLISCHRWPERFWWTFEFKNVSYEHIHTFFCWIAYCIILFPLPSQHLAQYFTHNGCSNNIYSVISLHNP